jgi:TolC family type I secretion outer membrane protein
MKPRNLLLFILFCTSSQPVIVYAQSSGTMDNLNLYHRAAPVRPVEVPAPVYNTVAPPAATSANKALGRLDLNDALGSAYLFNPDLKSARAAQRATDEEYAQARAGFLPVVTGAAGYVSQYVEGDSSSAHADPKTISVGIVQPLYTGGSTVADTKRAGYRVRAGGERLTDIEQTVLLDAVTAYLNVLRDQEIVQLNINNESVLTNHLDASQERFRLGDITRTDVSQAESRKAASTSARVLAEGNLKISRAVFERTIGMLPDNLAKPNTLPPLPAGLEQALNEALANNPVVLAAQYDNNAAAALTRSIRGELLPAVDISGDMGRTYNPSSGIDDYVDDRSVGIQATIPLYAGGGTYSRIRQARQLESQTRSDMSSAARRVRQNVISAWETYVAAEAQMKAQDVQIEAARLAEEGVRVEANYGSRTTLDLLDAEQEYLNAQVSRVISERDRTVAAYSLLAAVGRLTAKDLKLDVPVYNPDANFQKVKNRWIGTKIGQTD